MTSTVDGSADYGYDPTQQLTSATYVGSNQPPNESYSYDKNGNRTNTGYTTGANNELTSDGTFNYQHDAEGNLTVRTRISGAYATDYRVTYAWDYRDRLTDVSYYDNNSVLTKHVHYVYDLFDHLLATEADTTGSGSYNDIEHYILDVSPETPTAGQPGTALADPLLIINQNGVITARLFNGPGASGTDTVIDQEAISTRGEAGADGWSLTDNLNTPRYIVNDNSAVVDHVMAESFGAVTSESNPTIAHWAGFEGGHVNPFTGLVNDYHRWYDPTTGKWLAVDPVQFAAGETDSTRYVENNPTSLSDSAGLFPGSGGPQLSSSTKYMKWCAQMTAEAKQNYTPPYTPPVQFYVGETYATYHLELVQYLQNSQFSMAQIQSWLAQVQAAVAALDAAIAAARAQGNGGLVFQLVKQRQLMLETEEALQEALQLAPINGQ